MDRLEWEIENERRKILQDQMVTDMKKEKFMEELKNGLGEKIKNEPNKIQKKSTLLQKIKRIFS